MIKQFLLIPLLLTLVLSSTTQANARVVETHRIADILQEIDQDTLVLFDIDETTLTTTSTLGTSAWWDHFKNKLAPTKNEKEKLKSLLFPIIHKVSKTMLARTVEPETAQLIRTLQDRGITVLALTGRCKEAPWDPQFAEHTRDQLKSLDIDFTRSVCPPGVSFDHAPPCYAYGIIFTDFQPKGPVLMKVLNTLKYRPKKIVMADDLHEFMQSIEQSMAEEGIPFVGFRYSHLDHHVEGFDPLIGNIQLRELLTHDRYIDDEQAGMIKQELLKQNPEINPDFYLEELFKQLRIQIQS